tara:strand:+ start:40 stop:1935 length:1896 start_codon:yes stop_codon:yes gene_type:complete
MEDDFWGYSEPNYTEGRNTTPLKINSNKKEKEEEERVNVSHPDLGYGKEIDFTKQYISKDGSLQNLSDNFRVYLDKDTNRPPEHGGYFYKPHEMLYDHPEDLGPGIIPGTKRGNRWEWVDRAGGAVGEVVMSSPTLRTVLPPMLQALSYLELPGEEWVAGRAGHGAEVLGIDKRIGETLGYGIYPGLGDLKPISKIFSANLDDLLTNPKYGKFDLASDYNRSQANLNKGIKQDLNKPFNQIKGGGSGFVIEGNWQRKYTDKFTDKDLLKRYEKAAFDHRNTRTRKKDLMKDFIFEDNKPYITDDAGNKYLIVRRDTRVKGEEFISNKNYTLKSEEDITKTILANSEETLGFKNMKAIRRKINKGEFSLLSDKQFYGPLIEFGVGKSYLEHKIAKGQDWFWKIVRENPEQFPWLENMPNGKNLIEFGRNSEFNVRILFNKNYKKLKDSTEFKVNKFNSGKKDMDKVIVTIEDPQHISSSGIVDFSKMNNPGNISIIRVSDGKKIGVIPDYLMALYSPEFKKGWAKYHRKLINTPGNPVPEFYRLKGVQKKNKQGEVFTVYTEDFEAYRNRVLTERVELILNKADDTDATQIGEHIQNFDRSDFYEIFNSRTDGWIPQPASVTKDMKGDKFDR